MTKNSQVFNQKTKKTIFKKVYRDYVWPYRGWVKIAVMLMAIEGAMTAISAKLIEDVLDKIFIAKNENAMWVIAITIGIVGLVKGFSSYGHSLMMGFVGQKVVTDIQKKLFDHLMHADLMFFLQNSSGTLTSRFIHDISLMRGMVSNAITSLGKDTSALIFLMGVMFYQDWRLASAVFFIFPITLLFVFRFGRKAHKISVKTQGFMGGFTDLLNQAFQGIRYVKSYSREDFETKKAAESMDEIFRLNFKATRVRCASRPINEILMSLGVAVAVIYGGYRVMDPTDILTTGSLISFIFSLAMSYEPAKRLANLNSVLQEGLAAGKRLFDVLDQKPKIVRQKNAQPLVVNKGNIVFEQVAFGFTTEHGYKQVLNHVDLDIPAGKITAFVGPSGAGKTTAMNLIPRFFDPDQGVVRVDGQDIHKMDLRSVRQSVALVSQEVSLFNDTLAANIAYGRLGHVKMEDIIQAAKDAEAHEFIMQQPQGYETKVGELGFRLSGGQRQRIAIARAILKNAPILLLDEATSALDTITELQIQNTLRRLMQGKTAIIIAHRLSSIQDADQILVWNHGQVIEAGTHRQLLQDDGLYADLYRNSDGDDSVDLVV